MSGGERPKKKNGSDADPETPGKFHKEVSVDFKT